MKRRYVPLEMVGAVVGAGLASGREIAAFFSRFGAWSRFGVVLACAVLGLMMTLQRPGEGRLPVLRAVMQKLLLAATGGSMLSAAGHVAGLVLPFHGAEVGGMLATLLAAWLLARRTGAGLAWVSALLMAGMAATAVLSFLLPPMRAVRVADAPSDLAWMLRAVCYGGFNAALTLPAISRGGVPDRRGIALGCGLLTLLLLAMNEALLRHPALLGEALPFIRLLGQWGGGAQLLGAICLYLASLSTLTACLRGLDGAFWAAATGLCALLGFEGAVDALYPLLGAACLLLMAANLRIYRPTTFISRRDML